MADSATTGKSRWSRDLLFKGLSLTGERRHGRFLVAARAFQKELPRIRWTQEHLALNGDILPSCESYKKRLPAMQAVLRAVLGEGGGRGRDPLFSARKRDFLPLKRFF